MKSDIRKQQQISFLFLLIGYSIFGFSFLFSKNALSYASPFVMLGVRFAVAFLFLNIIIIVKKIKLHLLGKQIFYLFLLGLVQPVLYFVCESYGVKMLQTSFVGIILSLIPMVSFLVGFVFLKEKIHSSQILFAVLSIIGVFFTTIGQGEGTFSWIGFFLIIGSVITAALFNVISRKVASSFSAFERTYVMLLIGFITFSALGILESRNNLYSLLIVSLQNPSFWVSILFLACFSSVGAFILINYAMTYVSVAKASIFTNLTTVISIVAGVVFLNEHFGWFQLIGSIIIIVSVIGVTRYTKRQEIIPETVQA